MSLCNDILVSEIKEKGKNETRINHTECPGAIWIQLCVFLIFSCKLWYVLIKF